MADQVGRAIRFRSDFDAWWPDYDHAPEACFRFVQRGLRDIDIAARRCRHRRVAVQAGAHAGFWPRELSKLFRKVYAFEPEPDLFECARRNLQRWRVSNVDLRAQALGAEPARGLLHAHRSAGSWTMEPTTDWAMGAGMRDDGLAGVTVDVVTIDALDLAACDAIYLDVEGAEVSALQGAGETIKRFRPLIHLEVLPGNADAISIHMQALGYVKFASAHKDAVYRPEEIS